MERGGHARTHALLLPVGLLAQWQKYCGYGAPRKIGDGAGAEVPPRRTAFVSHLVRIFNTYTEVSGNAEMWGMGKGKTFLWFYTVQSRNWQVEGGTPVMVALTPCSDWLSLSTRSSHGLLVCVWRKTTCDRQLGFRCVFYPYCFNRT